MQMRARVRSIFSSVRLSDLLRCCLPERGSNIAPAGVAAYRGAQMLRSNGRANGHKGQDKGHEDEPYRDPHLALVELKLEVICASLDGGCRQAARMPMS